jgi:hypothetical protein
MLIVVARYNEDINWTKQFPNVKIYNKGEPLNDNYNEEFLDNVGREGHTYYKYIYDNYDNLEDYTIFLQGEPFYHCPDLVERINKYMNEPELNISFNLLSRETLPTNLSGCPCHYNLPLIDVYERIFGERKTEMGFMFGSGGQFIVSRDAILKRPREFYLKIVEMLQYDRHPIEGYVMERFHTLVFNGENNDNNNNNNNDNNNNDNENNENNNDINMNNNF